MQPRNNPRLARDMTILGGWLFADLLLALAIIFLAAQPPFPKPLPPTVRHSPTATPTPQTLARLELNAHSFVVHVNKAAFLKNDPAALNSVKQQIARQGFLQGRSAGLIIAYGTASSDCQAERAYEIPPKVYTLIQELGKSNPTFANTVSYGKLCNLRSDVNQIGIDIFLFAQSR